MQFEWMKKYPRSPCLRVNLSSEEGDISDVETGETEAEDNFLTDRHDWGLRIQNYDGSHRALVSPLRAKRCRPNSPISAQVRSRSSQLEGAGKT